MPSSEQLQRASRQVRDELLAERDAAGRWTGRLSSSALSTATAASALAIVARRAPGDFPAGELQPLVGRAIGYLAGAQNADGGWGDTDRSGSNIATTMLVEAALHLAGAAEEHAARLTRAAAYIASRGGIAGLRRRYGKDKTFAVPILANCALAGLVPWSEVAPLPFELACLPHWLLGAVRLPVVSYALPALVAVGRARFVHLPPGNPLVRLVRRAAERPALAALGRMQPASGGYLEATPLTSFVVMSLAGSGLAGHPVVRDGVRFLRNSVRDDGSWPIDTNLATWLTTLSLAALDAEAATPETLDWLVRCQHRRKHPFTSARPGGWAWTDASGGVPDADDTAGALVALARALPRCDAVTRAQVLDAAALGIEWLLDLQNADGGWPTFCRGWGTLPFDRSGVDLTAHALRAIRAWSAASIASARRMARAEQRGFEFLFRRQQGDGSWLPLWFGNQHRADEANPVYGTARVLVAFADLGRIDHPAARRGVRWLAGQQNSDGGWGAPGGDGGPERSSVEETALAVEALLAAGDGSLQAAIDKGLQWLLDAVAAGRHRRAAPIGFYFARLWYYEKLYPLVFVASALGRALK